MTSSEITHGTGMTNKHYSFLNVLDNIATSSASLAFAPVFTSAPSKQINQENAVKRLSETLQTLRIGKYGHKHLPELPVPNYDNGNIEIRSTSCSRAGLIPILTQTSSNAPKPSAQEAGDRAQRVQHHPLASLGQTFNANNFTEMTQFQGHTPNNSFQSSCHASNTTRNRTSHLSSQKSRPVSLCSISTAGPAPVHTQPGSSDSVTRSAHSQNKSVTFDDQRACPPDPQQSPRQRLASGTQAPRRGFRFIASFKDLRVKSEKRGKIEDARPASTEEAQMQLMSLREALRGVAPLSPLHHPKQDQKFTQECSQLLSLRQEASKNPFIAPLRVKQLPGPPYDMLQPETAPDIRHPMRGRRASEAMSVSTSILDWDWPQPGTYMSLEPETAQDLRSARKDSLTIPLDDSLPKMWTAPSVEKVAARSPPKSAPPEFPLPRLPLTEVHANGVETIHNSCTHHYQAVDASIQLEFPTASPIQNSASASSRVTKLAASKILTVDSTFSSHTDVIAHDEVPVISKLPLSPLKLRFNKSNRNSKVNELKRRHLSKLITAGGDVLADGLDGSDAVDFARGVSAPDAVQSRTATMKARRPSAHGSCMSVDKYKPLPLTPGDKSHSRKSSAPSLAVRRRTPNSAHNPSGTSPTSRCRSKQSLAPAVTVSKHIQTLSHSDVMTVIDSDPRSAHGFCAGPFGPAPTEARQQTQPKLQRPAFFEISDRRSSEDSRPWSSQSAMSWTTTDSSTMTSIAISFKPGLDRCKADTPLNASFDSGYSSSHDTMPYRGQTSAYVSRSTKSDVPTSDQLELYDQLPSTPNDAQRTDPGPGKGVEQLKDEVRMKRVYNDMLRARKGLAQEYMNNKGYAELLEDDMKARPPLPEIRASNVLEMIKADLANTPPKAHVDSERTIKPTPIPKHFPKSASDGEEESQVDIPHSVPSSYFDVPIPLRVPLGSSAALSGSPSITNATIEAPGRLPLKAGSTLLSASRNQPSSAVSWTNMSIPHSKRYSILSLYNLHTSRQPSPSSSHIASTTSSPSAASLHHTLGQRPPKQVAIGPIMPAGDIDQETDFHSINGNVMPPFLTNTRQMDRAIDALQALGNHHKHHPGPPRSRHRNGGMADLRKTGRHLKPYQHL